MKENELNLAVKSQRIINLVVDMVAFFVVWIILIVIITIAGLNQTYTDETGEQIPLVPFIVLLPTFWGYYILTEILFQKTLGKFLTKTKVVSLTGSKPSAIQIVFRTLSRSIPFEYLSYLLTVEGIHDRLSKTRVVKA
jgi:uncharacterized RDD family membrane protein YckC